MTEASLSEIVKRAEAISAAGGLQAALDKGSLAASQDVSVSEALVLGLLRQGVRKYLAVFGHGSTALGEVLRVYEDAGVIRTFAFHNEVAMAHAATALKWQYGETPAVLTSIGPGGLQAMAGSLTSITNGIGLYHIYGDETTFGESHNLQQVPKQEQAVFSKITALMGESYQLHTREAMRDMLKAGSSRVFHPFKAGPFYVHLPMNVQPEVISGFNLNALPARGEAKVGPASNTHVEQAVALLRRHKRVFIKAGGGARNYGAELRRLAETIGAVVTASPVSHGLLPDDHPLNMLISGGKGSICGNFAMANADLVLIVGSRGVCQADCSGIGYESAEAVININASPEDALHYNKTVPLVGDIGLVADQLNDALSGAGLPREPERADWIARCAGKKAEWRAHVTALTSAPAVLDPAWGRPVLTQAAAIKAVLDFATEHHLPKFFDAGDVQSNAMQLCADPAPAQTYTDGGASYMGFASSALVAGGLADNPRYGIAVTGDGSFWMNPQVLINAAEHGARGCVVLLDNRRMGAISSLQMAQYGKAYRTSDCSVQVDYLALARAIQGVQALDGGNSRASLQAVLAAAVEHQGLTLIHVPVLWNEQGQGNIGTYGRWSVGNWCDAVQQDYLKQDL